MKASNDNEYSPFTNGTSDFHLHDAYSKGRNLLPRSGSACLIRLAPGQKAEPRPKFDMPTFGSV
jgi:hypothetical protein